jgi:hypothetical protein
LLAVDDATALAQTLLGADTAADSGETADLHDSAVSGGQIALGDVGDEVTNRDANRAALLAAGLLTAQAAQGLEFHLGQGVTTVHLIEGMAALLGI